MHIHTETEKNRDRDRHTERRGDTERGKIERELGERKIEKTPART